MELHQPPAAMPAKRALKISPIWSLPIISVAALAALLVSRSDPPAAVPQQPVGQTSLMEPGVLPAPETAAAEAPPAPRWSTWPVTFRWAEAEVEKLEGTDTAKAAMHGRISTRTAMEYCQLQFPDQKIAPDDACVRQVLSKAAGQWFEASANCPARTVRTAEGRALRFAGHDEGGGVQWLDPATREIVGGTEVEGGIYAVIQFEILCPATRL